MTASASDISSLRSLLGEATRRFDATPRLRDGAPAVIRLGFDGAARWTAEALAELRGATVRRLPKGAVRLGVIKYGLATGAALTVLAAAFVLGRPLLIPGVVVAFYLVESTAAFVFPAFADGDHTPFATSRRLVRESGGLVLVASRMIAIAVSMVLGGFFGRGFVRSWCIGCLAVVLWYERLTR